MNGRAMLVQVEISVDRDGIEKPRLIRFNRRQVEVIENIDQWQGADYRYFKVKGSDGSFYMLRHNEVRADWELTMYEHSPNRRKES